jgi:hypothetical protein
MNAVLYREDYLSKVPYEVNERFKKLMKDARIRMGWRTQEEAGHAIGVSQSLISSFESRGLYDGMRFLDFRRVIKACGVGWVEIERVFDDPDEPPKVQDNDTRELLLRKFRRIPADKQPEALRTIEMMLDAYGR